MGYLNKSMVKLRLGWLFGLAIAFVLPFGSARLTATAIIHEEDEISGSVVFHQWNRNSPVIVSVLFENINLGQFSNVDWSIHDEPVHYDMYSTEERCGIRALKSVMRVGNVPAGQLGTRHGMIRSTRFAQVLYDYELSLYSDSPKNIIGKSFVIRQGKHESSHRCATIELSGLHSQRPGAIPCEMVRYDDCLVGTARDDVCIFRPCKGFRRYWGELNATVTMCAPRYERYPKPLSLKKQVDGVVRCKHGNRSLLQPL